MSAINAMGMAAGTSPAAQMRYYMQARNEVKSGQVPTSSETYTTLRYKLDMDERGVLKSASPRDSIRAVTGQEQMNVRRLSAEARARGEVVVAVDVDYKADIVDGKLAIRAGHTEVYSRPTGGKPVGGGMYLVEDPAAAYAQQGGGRQQAERAATADERGNRVLGEFAGADAEDGNEPAAIADTPLAAAEAAIARLMRIA